MNDDRAFFVFMVTMGVIAFSTCFLMITLAVWLIGGMAGWWSVQ